MSHLYRTFNSYLQEIFGTKVYRVPLDAGLTCPNRDGTRAFGGCTFCDDRGSGAPTIKSDLNILEQLEHGIKRIRRRYGASKFLAYFQSFTNTYAPEGILRSLYEASLSHPDVVGICIGTRPDCLPDNVLDLLSELSSKTFVWLEIGLQSAFNETLQTINRAHSSEEFFDAVARAKQRQLNVACHLIFGLPGENASHMLESTRQAGASGIAGIKIHQLCIYKGTPLEAEFRQGKLKVLAADTYTSLVADALEILPPHLIVMRLVAEGSQDELIAPAWSFEKAKILEKINHELTKRGTRQGSFYQAFSNKSAAPIIPA